MHCLEASTVWLHIARSAFMDGFLPTLLSRVSTLQILLGHWGALIRIGCVPDVANGRLDLSCGYVYFCHLLGTQHYCLWPNGRESLPLACPLTATTPHSPHPLISDTHDITVAVKNYFNKLTVHYLKTRRS